MNLYFYDFRISWLFILLMLLIIPLPFLASREQAKAQAKGEKLVYQGSTRLFLSGLLTLGAVWVLERSLPRSTEGMHPWALAVVLLIGAALVVLVVGSSVLALFTRIHYDDLGFDLKTLRNEKRYAYSDIVSIDLPRDRGAWKADSLRLRFKDGKSLALERSFLGLSEFLQFALEHGAVAPTPNA